MNREDAKKHQGNFVSTILVKRFGKSEEGANVVLFNK